MQHKSTSASLLQNCMLGDAEFVSACNKLLAEFMEYKLVPSRSPFLGMRWRKENLNNSPLYPYLEANEEHQLWFHTQYNWIMPVLERIGTLDEVEEVKITRKKVWIKALIKPFTPENYKKKLLSLVIVGENGTTWLQALWLAAVEFVKWYNEYCAVSNSIA